MEPGDGRSPIGTGWAVYASGPAGELAGAGGVDGLGRPIEPSSKFHTYCTIKPLLAMAVARLVDEAEVSFDDRVVDILGDVFRSRAFADTTVWDLLTHRSGIHEPSAVASTILSPEVRLDVAVGHAPATPALDDGTSRYTEAAAWIVLGALIEVLVERELATWVSDEILRPLALAHEFDLGASINDDVRLNVTMTRGRCLPLLIERTEALAWGPNPGYGGRATMRGLAGLLRELADADAGEGRVLEQCSARHLLRPEARRFDHTLGKRCQFAGGLMTNLRHHTFGASLGSRSFGHGGLIGMTTLWCDPDIDVVACYHVNGLCHPSRSIEGVRPTLVSHITSALAP